MTIAVCYDAVIVGAGPAGSLTAYHLARNGLRVVILEKKKLPRYKPCGGGLTARALSSLPFGIETVIEDYTRQPNLLYRNRLVFRQDLDRPAIAMVMRDRFDAYLAAKAVEAGAEVRDATAFRAVSGGAGKLSVRTDRGDWKTRIIVGADGVHSRVGRQLGLCPEYRTMTAVEGECYYGKADLPVRYRGAVHFDFGVLPKGYGWVFPKQNHLSIGVVTLGRHRQSLFQDFHAYLELKGLSAGVRVHPLRGHLIPFAPRGGNLYADRRGLLVGDAAGFTDPLTGEGIYYAVRGAAIAAEHIRKALDNGYDQLPSYTSAIQQAFAPDLIRAERMSRFIYHCPKMTKILLHHKGDIIGRCQLDIITGRKTYRQLFRQILSFWRREWWQLV
ncbi:MAG: geranylgeranyl reductase family protein [Thermodesulfobacteriota bacterium]